MKVKRTRRAAARINNAIKRAEAEALQPPAAPANQPNRCDRCTQLKRTLYRISVELLCIDCVPACWHQTPLELIERSRSGIFEINAARQGIVAGRLG